MSRLKLTADQRLSPPDSMMRLYLLPLFAFLALGPEPGVLERLGAQDTDPFSNEESSDAAVSISSHPDGESAVERMTVLAHTEFLPNCDKIIAYALTAPKPFDDSPREPIPADKAFPSLAAKSKTRILATKTLVGRDAQSLCRTWRSMKFDKWASAFCHEPVYGLRFFRDDQLIFETSVCWKCSNFYLPDVGVIEKGKVSSQWYGFVTNEASAKLLADLRSALPHPELKADQ